METKAEATVEAFTVCKGTANRFLKKTSMAVNTYVYGVVGNAPMMSICRMSPGNEVVVETSRSGGFS